MYSKIFQFLSPLFGNTSSIYFFSILISNPTHTDARLRFCSLKTVEELYAVTFAVNVQSLAIYFSAVLGNLSSFCLQSGVWFTLSGLCLCFGFLFPLWTLVHDLHCPSIHQLFGTCLFSCIHHFFLHYRSFHIRDFRAGMENAVLSDEHSLLEK